MSQFINSIILGYIAEKTFIKMEKEMKEYGKVKEALDFCWNWIENKEADIDNVYNFLDDPEEDDLVFCVISAKDEKEKKALEIILGVVSYISLSMLEREKEPIPQFLEEIDMHYFDSIVADAITLNIIDDKKKLVDKITSYYQTDIIQEKKDIRKNDIMKIV